MKITTLAMPTPWDIDRSPELASLYLLFEALEVANRCIIAAHPDLLNDEQYRDANHPDTKAAMLLLASLDRLAQRILHYTKYLSTLQKHQPELRQLVLPF